ncbi:MAG: hypothetical protein J7K65_00840 [Planctomycetes bacterium]|nr:hypothetical protein [Planctomycetota bacterium]
MSRTSIQKAIDQFPDLTDFGMGIFRYTTKPTTPEEREAKFKQNQAALLDSVDSFEKTCDWLSTKKKIKTINSKHSSYGLKHMAEHEIGYITNGVFIAAAIHCGFDIKIDGGPNVMINISEKSLKNCENL